MGVDKSLEMLNAGSARRERVAADFCHGGSLPFRAGADFDAVLSISALQWLCAGSGSGRGGGRYSGCDSDSGGDCGGAAAAASNDSDGDGDGDGCDDDDEDGDAGGSDRHDSSSSSARDVTNTTTTTTSPTIASRIRRFMASVRSVLRPGGALVAQYYPSAPEHTSWLLRGARAAGFGCEFGAGGCLYEVYGCRIY